MNDDRKIQDEILRQLELQTGLLQGIAYDLQRALLAQGSKTLPEPAEVPPFQLGDVVGVFGAASGKPFGLHVVNKIDDNAVQIEKIPTLQPYISGLSPYLAKPDPKQVAAQKQRQEELKQERARKRREDQLREFVSAKLMPPNLAPSETVEFLTLEQVRKAFDVWCVSEAGEENPFLKTVDVFPRMLTEALEADGRFQLPRPVPVSIDGYKRLALRGVTSSLFIV